MTRQPGTCPQCEPLDRRDFLRVAAVAAGAFAAPSLVPAKAETAKSSESIVKLLYASLDDILARAIERG